MKSSDYKKLIKNGFKAKTVSTIFTLNHLVKNTDKTPKLINDTCIYLLLQEIRNWLDVEKNIFISLRFNGGLYRELYRTTHEGKKCLDYRYYLVIKKPLDEGVYEEFSSKKTYESEVKSLSDAIKESIKLL